MGHWRLGWNEIGIERSGSFFFRFLRNRSRRLGSNFFDCLFDRNRLRRGNVIDREFRDGLDCGQLLGCRSVLRGGLHFGADRVERGFVIGDSLQLFEGCRRLLGHAVIEVEADFFDGLGRLLRVEL